MAKLDIFKREWVDMLFEGRNKSYGAYQLRSDNPKVMTKSFLIGAALFSLALAFPLIAGALKSDDVEQSLDEDIVLVDMTDIATPVVPDVPEEVAPPPPPQEEATKSINDQVKFTEPKVVEAKKVTEEIATVEELKKADPAQETKEGDKEKGEVKVNEATGNADKGKGVPGGNGDGEDTNKVYMAVEKTAEPPGGLQAFYKTFAKKYNAPEVDEGIRQIKVTLSFVVEKDGSFTNVRVLRDPGFGAGREAIRVLNTMPKWAPAQQNGRAVRSQFSLPITIQVQ
ncbi:MAG: energy transducer TonB [Flavobacterium sp.]|nr:energy transducer TonB [Candidatus Neoflavobacterium equi]